MPPPTGLSTHARKTPPRDTSKQTLRQIKPWELGPDCCQVSAAFVGASPVGGKILGRGAQQPPWTETMAGP